MRNQMSLFKIIIIFLTITVLCLSGCFSSASPGMKVLKITGEQYFNDAKRYLRETLFIYDGSKINTVMTNIEKNEDGIKKEAEDDARLMIDYLSLLKQYANLVKTSRRPARKDIEKIYDKLKDKNTDDYKFLKIFYYYLRSYSHRGLEDYEIINVYNLLSYFKGKKDYRFPFFMGGEPITFDFIRYFSYMTLMQNNYIMLSLKQLEALETGNKLHPVYLLTMGEAYMRAGKYEEAIRYLKYFRLPTYSTFALKEYALMLLKDIYVRLEKTVEQKAIDEKMELTLRMKTDDMFCYFSEQEIDMYEILVNDKKEKEKIEDMLDLYKRGGEYMRPDFNDIELNELVDYYNTTFDVKISDSDEVKIDNYTLYDYLKANPELDLMDCLLYFDKSEVVVMSKMDSEYFFVKADDKNLRKREKDVFRFKLKDYQNKEVLFDIEYSPKGKGVEKVGIKLLTGEKDG